MDTNETNATWSLESEEWWARYRAMIQRESMRAPGLPWTKNQVEKPAPAAEYAPVPATNATPCTVPAAVYNAAPCSAPAVSSGSAYGLNTGYGTASSGSAYSMSTGYTTALSGSAYVYGAAVSSGSGYMMETSGSYIGSGSFPSSGSGSGSGSSGYGAEFGGYGLHLL